jgi:rfaE bifunctional protein nucleotidyltransferase chain/domain
LVSITKMSIIIEEKIKTREEMKRICNDLKKENKKIVTTNGAFDMIHIGHVRSLRKAKSLGDVLIVGLNSDSSIKKYKSPDRPIISQDDRAEMLASLDCVDYVVIFEELDSREFLKSIKPDIHVKSKKGYTGIEKDAIESNGGKIILVDDSPGISTTSLIEKIKILLEKEKTL